MISNVAPYAVRKVSYLDQPLNIYVLSRGRSGQAGHDVGRNGPYPLAHEHPVVLPHVSHFRHVPLRTMVKLPHSGQASPT
jgi:hypothetical protein